jgi:hypothetical protein
MALLGRCSSAICVVCTRTLLTMGCLSNALDRPPWEAQVLLLATADLAEVSAPVWLPKANAVAIGVSLV